MEKKKSRVPPLESRFSDNPPMSPIEDILNQNDPQRSTIDEFLEISEKISQRAITNIQIAAFDKRKEYIQTLNEAMSRHIKKYPDQSRASVMSQGKDFLDKETLKIKTEMYRSITEILAIRKSRDSAIIDFFCSQKY